jgi:hypothetical protein
MSWIATNAGHEGSIVVQRLKDMKDEEGFNVQTEQYENLVHAGVIDPAKVVRSALQNAASIASLLPVLLQRQLSCAGTRPRGCCYLGSDPDGGSPGLRHNRRRQPMATFQTLLGLGTERAPTPIPTDFEALRTSRRVNRNM